MDANRLFIDGAMAALVAAEAHVKSLEEDVVKYREMLQMCLAELHSEKLLNARLMFRFVEGAGGESWVS